MFRYEVTTKIRTAVPLCWFVWARSEHEARVKQAESLNAQSSQYTPPWYAHDLIAVNLPTRVGQQVKAGGKNG